MGEAGRVLLKANVIRSAAALPHFVLYGALGGALFAGDPALGAIVGFKTQLLLVAVLPATPIFKYSPHTNDTSAGCLASGALLACGLAIGLPIIGLAIALFYWPGLGFAALPPIALLSWIAWRSYRAAAEKGALDLMARPSG